MTTAPEVKPPRPGVRPTRGGSDLDKPIAHYRRGQELKALCGKRLRGLPAPPEAEICVVCKEMSEGSGKGLRGSL